LLALWVDTQVGVVQVTSLSVENVVKFGGKFVDNFGLCAFISMWLELPDEVAILMQVVGYGVVAERLNLLLHLKVLVDIDLETAFHLFVIDLVLLAS